MQTRVDPTRDIIYVNGNRIPKKLPPKVYFALNKPKGLAFFSLFSFVASQTCNLCLIFASYQWQIHLFFRRERDQICY